MYVQLVEYLRVMWVPLGGFAAGYLAIILVFSGFCGMLERFVPGSFAGAADAGLGDWLSFSFFSAIAQDYSGITPVSAAARTLVGVRLLLSVGWALVVFSAMMTAIQPQLERIARRDTSGSVIEAAACRARREHAASVAVRRRGLHHCFAAISTPIPGS